MSVAYHIDVYELVSSPDPTLSPDRFLPGGTRGRGTRLCTVQLTTPMCLSTVNILLLAPTSCSFEVTSFSTPNTTPSLPRIPMAVLHKLDGKGETVLYSELCRTSWPITVHCYKRTHCFQQLLQHTQFGTPCHLVRTVLLTSRTGGEKEGIRYAGRRDNRPTKTPHPCPYRAHCPVVASAAVSSHGKLLKLDHVRVLLEWNGVATGNGIGKRAWQSSDPNCCVSVSLWSPHLFNAFVEHEGVAVSQAVAI